MGNKQYNLSETLVNEGLIPLHEVPKLLQLGRDGKKPHRALAWRWAHYGVKSPGGGKVRLEAIRVGKRWMTSRAAVIRFLSRTNPEGSTGKDTGPDSPRKISEDSRSTLARFGLGDAIPAGRARQ